jgi:FkbH-like protein
MSDNSHLADLPLNDLLLQRRALRRKLAGRNDLRPIRVAVLGGSTTTEIVKLLDLWLLDSGFSPTFHESEYGRYHTDAVHDSTALFAFKPDVVYVHTSVLNIRQFPRLGATQEEFRSCVEQEISRFGEIWDSIGSGIGCTVIQNNFELPMEAVLGNMDSTALGGRSRFIMELNREFATAAGKLSRLVIQDLHSIAARIGLDSWFDRKRWFSYKIATTLEGSRALAISLSALVRAVYGKVRKVLVLDLDNTLWGGVIGDDGPDNILIGRETPMGEAYTAFQEYCLALRNRGVLLAVCSKNDEAVARQGFRHPDSVLKEEHISCFVANWEPKHENIARIATALNLGTDSFVFIDDNAAERAIVEAQVDGIAVPNVGSDVTMYAGIIEAGRYFEQVSLSNEDIGRAEMYAKESQRVEFQKKFADYGAYLDSLEMTAEIDRFKPVYLERIAQLTNKTNQFNLTTRRFTLTQIEQFSKDENFIGLYGRLSDRFGDHGLVSVVLGHREADVFHIDLWLMSCRVLKRGMEAAMLDAIVAAANAGGARLLVGSYIPTDKNGMVADFYPRFGFVPHQLKRPSLPESATSWGLELRGYVRRSCHIKLIGDLE